MIEALKQMVEALENPNAGLVPHGGEWRSIQSIAIQAGKKAIAELESQEPVGRFAKFTDGVWRPVTDYSAGVPLYTHPPQRTWVGLTSHERMMCRSFYPDEAVAKTEAKLKEKNND